MKIELKRISPEIFKHKKLLYIVAITGVIHGIVYSRLAFIVKDLTDQLSQIKGVDTLFLEELYKISAIGLSLAVIAGITRYFHNYFMNNVGDLVAQSLREQLQSRFMKLSLTFHNQYAAGSGGLLSRVLSDVHKIQEGLRMVADIFIYPTMLVFLIGNLFYLDWRLASFVLLALPLIGLIIKNLSRSLRKYAPLAQEDLEKMSATIKESIDGIRVIQSFNLNDFLENKLRKIGQAYYESRKKINSRLELSGPVTELIATILFFSIVIYTGVQISKGEATVGTFLGFLTSLLMAGQPIKKFQDSFVRLQQVIVSIDRIYAIIDSMAVVNENPQHLEFPQDWKKIIYKNVHFSFGQEQVLKDLNFEINKGQVVALVGESGSGKSTIVNLLERFFDPDSGQISIDSTPIQEFSLKDLRNHIALVSQDVFLFSDSISNNIQSGNFNRQSLDVPQVSKLAHAENFILKMPEKYQSQVGDRGNLLSGGEKQRISIARAFFKNAPILILDEATSALDSASEVEVQAGLDTLMEGRTVIVVAHRLSTIQRADKIIVLKKGQIVEVGNHAELLSKKGEYSRFYNLQG
ncbi:MAG TPA: ABC transporter ATP-binding protein [Pseudobdellovibrionaceae bacterium]|nr:ABC transporter ATP-binding protein [Pseudobdellovibrionaceae bacterium]